MVRPPPRSALFPYPTPFRSFTADDKGVFAGSVTLKTAGSKLITATDSVTNTITGFTSVTVNAAPAVSISLAAPASTTAGVAFSVTVTAHDPFGNVAKGPTFYKHTAALHSH